MPTIIDPSKSTEEQIKDLTKAVQLSEQVNAKFFNSVLTGSKGRTNGHFHKTADTIKEYLQTTSSGVIELSPSLLLRDTQKSTDHTTELKFSKNSQEHLDEYREFANFPTMALLPRDVAALTSVLGSHSNAFKLSVPADTSLFSIALAKTDWAQVSVNGDYITAVKPYIESMTLYEKQVKSAKAGKDKESVIAGVPVIYFGLITYHKDMDSKTATVSITNRNIKADKDNAYLSIHSAIPDLSTLPNLTLNVEEIKDALDYHLSSNKQNKRVLPKEITATYEAIVNDSMSELLEAQAMNIKHNFETETTQYIKALLEYGQHENNLMATTNIAAVLTRTVHMFDTVNDMDESLISTTFLSDTYQLLKNHASWLGQKNINHIVKQSLRMLLSQRLHELEVLNKTNSLYQFKNNDANIHDKFKKDKRYSSQQKRIILTEEPLVIGQAGAGSGKSHTLMGRIQYLKENNEDLSKALVLSFTNVAAMVITNRVPEVRSETLANMFNTIYLKTYPMQQLSQPSTVANSISLLEPSSPMFSQRGYSKDEVEHYISRFTKAVKAFDQSGYAKVDLPQVTRSISNLIEDNLELTELLLDAIEQTTLELQPIIIHHHLLNNNNNLNIPKEYQDLNYIITDESQDISTFEYILLLELTIHYRSQLLIIGDGSQTLYEFRNSDPRYMNALEASGIFTAYKLDVNYRSNQEILMFANQFLDVIEANDYANIRLSANSFRQPTLATLQEKVTLDDLTLSDGKPQSYAEELKQYMTEDDKFLDWVLPKLQNGEQVAVLGWTRAEVLAAGEALEKIIKDQKMNIEITNIMSDNDRPSTIISDTIVKTKVELYATPFNPATYVQDIKKVLEKGTRLRYVNASPKQLAYFQSVINRAIDEVVYSPAWKALFADAVANNIKPAALLGHLTRELLRIETRKNATDQYLRKNKDVPDYDNAKVIISTIHGAKGLEFTHTIVLFNESKKSSTSQESLRMQFVALSRAKESEYIINAVAQRRFSNRVVTSNRSSMFITPMPTAYLRTTEDIATMTVNAQSGPTSSFTSPNQSDESSDEE